jgi:HTH-type transcriptional regulator/antitoxin HigA
MSAARDPHYDSWQLEPGTAPHPGETLAELLFDRQWKRDRFAAEIGTTIEHLNRILSGGELYGAKLAVRIAEVTGVPERFWLNLQTDYELNHARANRTK